MQMRAHRYVGMTIVSAFVLAGLWPGSLLAQSTSADRSIDLVPTDAHALGVLGDAYLEVGKYEAARETYGTMTRLRADLYSFSRRSGLRSLTGDPEGALEDLRLAIADGRAGRRPRESVAWAQWQRRSGCCAPGRPREAEAQCQGALGTCPNYYRALAGLAQVRAAQRRYEQAIELYKRALGVIPLPDSAAALGDESA